MRLSRVAGARADTGLAYESVAAVAERAVRLAEVVAALAAAADLGLGLPLDHGLPAGLIAMRLADLVDLAVHDREDLFYLTLLRMAGCTVESSSPPNAGISTRSSS